MKIETNLEVFIETPLQHRKIWNPVEKIAPVFLPDPGRGQQKTDHHAGVGSVIAERM